MKSRANLDLPHFGCVWRAINSKRGQGNIDNCESSKLQLSFAFVVRDVVIPLPTDKCCY